MTASVKGASERFSSSKKRLGAIAQTPLSYFGYGFCRVWVILEALYYADTTFVAGAISSKALFNIASAFAALAIAMYASKRFTLLGKKNVDMIAALLCIASSLCFLASETFVEVATILIAFADVLGAGGLVMSTTMWIEFYGGFNPTKTALYLSGSIVFGAVILFLVQGFVRSYAYGAFIFLPLAWLYCIRRARNHARQAEPLVSGRKPSSFPWKIAVFLAIYGFAYAMASSFDAFSPEEILYPWRALSAVPALVVIASIVFSSHLFNYDIVYRIAFPFMICGFLMFFITPDTSPIASSHLIRISYAAASLLSILVICGIAYRMNASVVWLYAVVDFCQRISMFLGSYFTLSLFYHELSSNAAPIIPIVVTVLIVIATLLLLSEKTLFTRWGISSKDSDDRESLLGVHIEDLAAERNLTQRETEILLLLAKGETADSIAKTMFIAKGTAKAHIHHVYVKLNVHSRKELLALLRVNDGTAA